MIDGTRSLVVTRWTLVDRVDRDGPGHMAVLENRQNTPGLESLTAREREVVRRAVAGSTNKAIAYDLGIADATVRVLLWRAYGKLGVRSRRDLIAKAFLLGQGQAGSEMLREAAAEPCPVVELSSESG
jgi:DNA-binding CsgD family transcriptional regulator